MTAPTTKVPLMRHDVHKAAEWLPRGEHERIAGHLRTFASHGGSAAAYEWKHSLRALAALGQANEMHWLDLSGRAAEKANERWKRLAASAVEGTVWDQFGTRGPTWSWRTRSGYFAEVLKVAKDGVTWPDPLRADYAGDWTPPGDFGTVGPGLVAMLLRRRSSSGSAWTGAPVSPADAGIPDWTGRVTEVYVENVPRGEVKGPATVRRALHGLLKDRRIVLLGKEVCAEFGEAFDPGRVWTVFGCRIICVATYGEGLEESLRAYDKALEDL